MDNKYILQTEHLYSSSILTTEKPNSTLPKVVCCKRTALLSLGVQLLRVAELAQWAGLQVLLSSKSKSEAWAALLEFK